MLWLNHCSVWKVLEICSVQTCIEESYSGSCHKEYEAIRLSMDMMSNRDARFAPNCLGMGRQTERINQLIEEYLWYFCDSELKKLSWIDILETTQFCYNQHKYLTMGFRPLELALVINHLPWVKLLSIVRRTVSCNYHFTWTNMKRWRKLRTMLLRF